MSTIDIWLRAWLLALSVVLFSVSILAYNRERNRLLLLVSGLFSVFLFKGIMLGLGIFYWTAEELVGTFWFERGTDMLMLLFILLIAWVLPFGGRENADEENGRDLKN